MSLAPKTVREQVTDKLRDELVSGRFAAGVMLREIELAERFGVSRGPVRDAFIQLSHEGFLAYHANRGVMVRQPPNAEDRKFIVSLRQQIETYVVEKGIGQLNKNTLESVNDALKSLKAACDAGVAPQVALRDVEFHETVMIACGGEDLVGAWRQLCSRMLMTYTRLRDYDQAYEEHVAIFNSLRDKKVKTAVSALKANIS